MKKLTIGMATYDDYDGVFFSVQAIRMYHPEIMDQVEILVVDNNPSSPSGKETKKLIDAYVSNGRYIPFTEYSSSFVKGKVFEEAQGEYVLCIDCHVLLVTGALKKLIDYYSIFPNTKDLLQGPLIHDDLKSFSTHFKPEWSQGMFGTWDNNQEALDKGDPFEIPMQGCGLLSCKKEHWVGFNPEFRGFGGEEWYVQEKFRKQGGNVLCLPFLQWMHRFGRPNEPQYPLDMYDRIRNYLIGWAELYDGDINNKKVKSIVKHFITEGYEKEKIEKIVELLI
jgi:hypothetical protein|tara:strand:+ start:292 stop:1131 length:840 start_codon:yes stop_codon:yes gene_type:complete